MNTKHTDAEAIGQEYEGMYIVYRYWMTVGAQYQVIDADGNSKGHFGTLEKSKQVIEVIKKNGWYR